jgi:hypothetical protein
MVKTLHKITAKMAKNHENQCKNQPTATMTFFDAVSLDSVRREVLLYNNITHIISSAATYT